MGIRLSIDEISPFGEDKAVRRAIQLAEKAARGIVTSDPNPTLLAAHEVCQDPGPHPIFKARHAAFSTCLAAAAALDAAAAVDIIESQDYDYSSATQAFLACYHAAQATAGNPSLWVAYVMELQLDYDWLAAKAAEEGWTDDTHVPIEVVGPLWPQGEPLGRIAT
jgi:hypothetical protein